MIRTALRLLAPLLLVLPALLQGEAALPAPPPASAFFRNASVASAKISPDGTKVAFLADLQGRVGVALMDLATGKVEPLVRAKDENIETFFWKGSEYVLFMADVGGNEAGALQSINVKTRRILRIYESFGDNNAERQSGNFGNLVDNWKANPRCVIIQGGASESSMHWDFYSVDVGTGTRNSLPAVSDGDSDAVLATLFDSEGNLVVKATRRKEGIVVEGRYAKTQKKFGRLFVLPDDLVIGELSHPEVLADGRSLLFVDYSKGDRGALVRWDLETRKEVEVLFTPPEGEISGLRLDPQRTRVLGVEYTAAKAKWHWFDAAVAKRHASIMAAMGGQEVTFGSASDDEKKEIVYVSSDRFPGLYMLSDRSRQQPLLMPIGPRNPEIDPAAMAPMEPVTIRARDGMLLPGYLTKPLHAKAGEKLPLILNPHGGPYGIRDNWGYNAEVQFLASRGYAVLQVNYRGSGGCGRAHLEAGRLEWGKKMQDDLTDSVQWAIDQGIADPVRVAIYGASYGGYAALAGATFTPDLYCCAVNYVGVSDLTLLGKRDRGGSTTMNETYYKIWVHPDMEELRRRSPVNYVDKIRIPTMHAYGENDPRVEIRHWKYLKAALDKAGKPYEYLREGNEGHGFSNTQAEVDFYTRLEAFLRENVLKRTPVVTSGPSEVVEMPAK